MDSRRDKSNRVEDDGSRGVRWHVDLAVSGISSASPVCHRNEAGKREGDANVDG